VPETLVTPTFLERFLVAPGAAERYARGYAIDRGYLPAGARACVTLPRTDAKGNLLAWHFVLSDSRICDSFPRLLRLAELYWEGLRDTSRDAVSTPAALGTAMKRSCDHFFTVEVAAYSFRHPLHEAHAGLAPWALLAAVDAGRDAPRGCAPEAILPSRPAVRDFEIIQYRCGTTAIIYSQTQARRLQTPDLPPPIDPGLLFKRWQHVVQARYGRDTEAHLRQLEALWSRHRGGAAR
jgi:hypothetical protein